VNVWLYVFDEFKPLDISTDRLLELAENKPLELFEEFRDILTNYVKEIKSVRIYDIYFDPNNFELLIEYMIECELGEISVKIIHSRNPIVTLNRYYKYEKELNDL